MRSRKKTHNTVLCGAMAVAVSTGAIAQTSDVEPAAESAPSVVSAEEESLESKVQAAFVSAFEKCQSAVVRIDATHGTDQLSATGFFIDPAGTLVTHFSTVANADIIFVTVGKEKLPAKRLLADRRSGVALLKVEAATSFLPRADLSDLRVASPVMVAGFARELPLSPIYGLIAGFDKSYKGSNLPTMHIRATLPVEPGQAGAPMVNLRGEVIGMIAFCVDDGKSAYVLPIQAAEKIHHDYLAYGKVRYGVLGVEVDPLSIHGPEIMIFDPKSPALAAGLRIGDVVLSIGKNQIGSFEDLADAAFYLTAGESVPITVSRGGEKVTIEVVPVPHPLWVEPAAVTGPLHDELAPQ